MNNTSLNTRWWILGAMGAILGVILLDETVIAVALPTIKRELGVSTLAAHWFVNIYLLVLAVLAGAAGKLGDIVGARALLIAGLLIFGGASTLGGFSAAGTDLFFARLIQGIGAALIFPLSIFVVTAAFPEEERGLALGLYGAIGTSLLALGPLVGGLLTEYLSWRWIFWVNPPIVLLVAIVTAVCWRDPPRPAPPRFDWPGLAFLLSGMSMLVFGIMQGPELGWSHWSVALPLLGGVVVLALLVTVELKSPAPLIAVGLFANPVFTAFSATIFTAQFAKMAMFVFGAMFFQDTLGLSPLVAGAALLPSVAPQILTSPYAGKLTDRHGSRLPSLGGILGLALGIAIMAAASSFHSLIGMLAGLLLVGVVMPMLFVPPQHAILSSVEPHMQGQASGIAMTSQLMGATVGMAVCSTVYALSGSATAVFWLAAAVSFTVFFFAFFATRSLQVSEGS